MVFDLVELLAMYQSFEKLDELYQQYICVILKRDKEAETVAKDKGKQRRQMKKAYKMLHAILSSDNEGCVDFCLQKMGNIEKLMLQHGAKVSMIDGAEVSRLGCAKCLIEKQPEMNLSHKIVTRIVPEAVSAFNNEAVKQANISVDLLQLIGERFEAEAKLNEFVDIVIAGFAGDSQLISNTIWVLRDIIQQFTGSLTVETLKFILEQVLAFVVSNNRTEVNAAVNFVLTYTKILPGPLVLNYLPLIVKSLSLMVPDTKRHCRLLIGE
jgi:ribosomal RNA-processing protein 12